MEVYDTLKRSVDHNIIYCLFPMIISLIVLKKFFESKIDFKQVFNFLRLFIIAYTIITFTIYLIGMVVDPEKYAFIKRATGPYSWAYWVMFLGALVFPISLLFKPLGVKPWYLLVVSIGMNIGFYLEKFTIITVSIHRDYLPNNWKGFSINDFIGYSFLITWLQGVVLSLFLIFISFLVSRKKRGN